MLMMTFLTVIQERQERHRQNYMHITIHTSQTWADTFISELNDTHVEAELRTRNIPPLVRLERTHSCWPPATVVQAGTAAAELACNQCLCVLSHK
jgi:hypothetical protein